MVERFTDDDYWRSPLHVTDEPTIYEFLHDHSRVEDIVRAMLAIKRAIDDMPKTKATFKAAPILDANDLNNQHLPQEALWMLGVWPVPPIIAKPSPQKYVNPHYPHKDRYADVFYECSCGVVLDVCPSARYHKKHESNYHREGCEKWEQVHARAMLHEIRYDIAVTGYRMGKSFREISDRLGMSPESVRASLFDWSSERADREREIARRKLGETYQWLHVENDYTKADLAEIFPHTPGTIKNYINEYSTGDDIDARYAPRDRVTTADYNRNKDA